MVANQETGIQRQNAADLDVINLNPDEIKTIRDAAEKMELIVSECSAIATRDQPQMLQMVQMARGVSGMRALLKPEIVERWLLPLQGTPLGFVTDKDSSGGYPAPVVRDVAIEALIRGFRLVNNEVNIISGKFYGAKNGYERIVREFPGLKDLSFDLGVPELSSKDGALVAFEARWIYKSSPDMLRGHASTKPEEFDTRIVVRVNAGMGVSAILGKAERTMFKRIYQRLTGYSPEDAEPESPMPVEVLPKPAPAEQDGKRMKLGKSKQAPAEDPAERQPGED